MSLKKIVVQFGYFFLLFCLIKPFCVQAAIVSVTGNITRVGTGFSGEGLFLSINQTITTTCPNPNMIFMATTATQYKETVSIALEAYAMGKPITIYYDSSACPRGDIPTFVAVAVN